MGNENKIFKTIKTADSTFLWIYDLDGEKLDSSDATEIIFETIEKILKILGENSLWSDDDSFGHFEDLENVIDTLKSYEPSYLDGLFEQHKEALKPLLKILNDISDKVYVLLVDDAIQHGL